MNPRKVGNLLPQSESPSVFYTYDHADNRLSRDIDSAIYSTNDNDQLDTYDGLID